MTEIYSCDLCAFIAKHDEMVDHFYESHYSDGFEWLLNCTVISVGDLSATQLREAQLNVELENWMLDMAFAAGEHDTSDFSITKRTVNANADVPLDQLTEEIWTAVQTTEESIDGQQ